jgi:hypothetical protein
MCKYRVRKKMRVEEKENYLLNGEKCFARMELENQETKPAHVAFLNMGKKTTSMRTQFHIFGSSGTQSFL